MADFFYHHSLHGALLLAMFMIYLGIPSVADGCCDMTKTVNSIHDHKIRNITTLELHMRGVNQILLKVFIPKALRPPRPCIACPKFYTMLGELSHQMQQLQAMLTQQENQNDPKLTALSAILDMLVTNGCELAGLKNCTYFDLLKLKTTLDVFNTVHFGRTMVLRLLERLGGRTYFNITDWIRENIACGLPGEQVSLLQNRFSWSADKQVCCAN